MEEIRKNLRVFGVSLILLASGLVALAQPTSATHSSGEEFQVGDLFVSTESDEVWWYRISGTTAELKHKLTPKDGTGQSVGSTVGPDGHLLVAQEEMHKVDEWDGEGNALGTLGGAFETTGNNGDLPESVVVDHTSGDTYVGTVKDDTVDPQEARLYHFAHDGSSTTTLIDTDDRGIDQVDLADDRCTLYYTSEGPEIKRYDVCNNIQMSDFVDVSTPPHSESGSELHSLRQVSDDQVLVAAEDDIFLLNQTGIQMKYDADGNNFWYALTIDPLNPDSFLAADQRDFEVFRFDMSTGTSELLIDIPESEFPDNTDPDGDSTKRLSGLSVVGEPGSSDPCQAGLAFDGYYLTDQAAAEPAADQQMNQRTLGEPPSFNGTSDLTITDGNSVVYLANVAAGADSEHNAKDWTLHATTLTTGSSGYTAELGIWDTDNATFTAASSAATIDQIGIQSATLPVSSPLTFPEGDYLALRLTDTGDSTDTELDLVGPEVSPTCLEEPTQEEYHYPTPEIGTLALSGAGLLMLGMIGLRRRSS